MCKATFFVLGEVASEHPAIVRTIAEEGHEIACHGYHHTLVSGQSPEEFRVGIRRAKAVLEDVGGQPVIGYRAPSFSIGPSERWAYAILAEEGFRYDSSVYPILHDRYGDRDRASFPLRDLAKRTREADRVPDRDRPSLRRQSSRRGRRLLSPTARAAHRGGDQAGQCGGARSR